MYGVPEYNLTLSFRNLQNIIDDRMLKLNDKLKYSYIDDVLKMNATKLDCLLFDANEDFNFIISGYTTRQLLDGKYELTIKDTKNKVIFREFAGTFNSQPAILVETYTEDSKDDIARVLLEDIIPNDMTMLSDRNRLWKAD